MADHHSASPVENEADNGVDEASGKPLRKRHGARNQHKIKFFLRWLMTTFPSALAAASILQTQDDNDDDTEMAAPAENETTDPFFAHPLILDVAGGNGELAARMCFCNHQRVVLVDPRPANVVQCYEDVVFRGLPKKWQQRLRQKQIANPNLLVQALEQRFRQLTLYFDAKMVKEDSNLRTAVENAQLLVGMHADGATEAIVDIALQYKKPFVVVPCCVFPNFFPHRKIVKDGVSRQVRSYEDFCDYLVQKDARFNQSVLPFEGRNIAIWWDGR